MRFFEILADPIQSLMHRFKRSRTPPLECTRSNYLLQQEAIDAIFSFKKIKTNAKQQDLDIDSSCIYFRGRVSGFMQFRFPTMLLGCPIMAIDGEIYPIWNQIY